MSPPAAAPASAVSPLISTAQELARRTARLRFAAPVAHVYRPLEYAWEAHAEYLARHAPRSCEALLIGMNPGPFGMTQTGAPFGEVDAVRDWLGIRSGVRKPAREHPRRPIEGFDCRRSEVSGARLWGWARERFGSPARFFKQFFVANYCPLAFLTASGANLTPDKLPVRETEPLFAACDAALRAVVVTLRPRFVIGVGAFAEKRAAIALAGYPGVIGRILHPSPASPAANRDWAGQMESQLQALGLEM